MTDSTSSHAALIVAGTEKKSAGITSYWRTDGIFVVKVSDASRATADALGEVLLNFDQEGWQQSRHNLSIVDIRGIFPTPYATQRVIDVSSKTPPDLIESQAIIVDRSTLFQLIRLLLGKLTPKSREVSRIFFNEADAVQWLHQRALHQREGE